MSDDQTLDGTSGGLPQDLAQLFADTWRHLASPGAGWAGGERVAIAATARAARTGRPSPTDALPEAAAAATERIAVAPASATREWVEATTAAIGEDRYVELVGVVARLAAVDSITLLVDGRLLPLPVALPGEPLPPGEIPGLRRRSSWVAMAGPPRPRFALSAAPDEQRVVNRLIDRLYKPDGDGAAVDGSVRALSHAQAELLIITVSHGNECFY